jgi:hypothetical protein
MNTNFHEVASIRARRGLGASAGEFKSSSSLRRSEMFIETGA